MKARSHARAEMAHYYAGGGKDSTEAAKLYNYRLAKQGHPPDEPNVADPETMQEHLIWKMQELHSNAQDSAPTVSTPLASAPPALAVSDPESAHAQAKQIFSELGPEEQAKVEKILNDSAKPGQALFIPITVPEKKVGPPQFPGEQLSAGDHIIVGKHKFQVVEAPTFDPNMSHVIGQNYFKLKVKKPTGSKVFAAQVRDANGSPFWNVTDKGKQVVGGYSGGDEGHKKVSAEAKAPKHEAVKLEAIGKANEHDIDAVPTGLASAWHKRWSFGTQPEPVSGSLNKMIANYLVRHHERGMSAEDHMAAASFHQKYGADVMSGAKLPSLPHKTARSHRQQLHGALADFHEKMATNPDFVEKVYAIAGKKPKVKKSFSGIDGIGEYLENSRFEEIDMAKNSLEKGFPPPAAPAAPVAGNGVAAGGNYTRRWKGPAGKWLYEFDDPAHREAINASNTAETHPGTAGDLIGAHQHAAQAHLKASQSLNNDPQASAEHAQVAADHAKAAAVVHSNYFLEKDKAQAAGAAPPQPGQLPLPGQQPGAVLPKPPMPGQPPIPGQQPGAMLPKPPVPGQPPMPPGPPGAQPGMVPPKPPMPGQPGQVPVAPGAVPGAVPGAGPSAPPLPQPPPDMKTIPSSPGGGQTPMAPPQPGGKPVPEKPAEGEGGKPFQPGGKPFQPGGKPEAEGKPGEKPKKKFPFQKSLDGIAALGEYLAKAQGLPEGGPKEKMGTGEEQGGKVDGVGQQSGEDNSTSKGPGAPSVPQKKLSEDDEEDESQMKAHKKPIETAKSMAVPSHQRELVAREHAAEVSRLQKSDDVVFGMGIGQERPVAEPIPQSMRWKQGQDGFVVYSNQSDLDVERLTKSGEFYAGANPQISRVAPLVAQKKNCPSCKNLMAKSLAVCPECGDGAQRAVPRVISDGESVPSPDHNRPGLLRPARNRGDVFFPGK
jgi:hypothetical protein